MLPFDVPIRAMMRGAAAMLLPAMTIPLIRHDAHARLRYGDACFCQLF